jgi:hypothetical protein
VTNRPATLACIPALAIIAAAHAQPALNQPSGVAPPRFTRIESRIGDVDPLGVSLRQLSTDLRQPTGFRDVYRIEGSGAAAHHWGISNPSGADLFARRDGAITAVFPQSVYITTERGPFALIPPGTVFFIGDLPFDRFGALPPIADSPDRVDTRVDTRATTSSVTPATLTPGDVRTARSGEAPKPSTRPIEPAPALPGIMTDEPLRRRTVRDLIMKVVEPPEPKASPAVVAAGGGRGFWNPLNPPIPHLCGGGPPPQRRAGPSLTQA